MNIPVLIIRGDADPYLGATISEKLHRDIPGSRMVRIPTGGHFIQEDEPEKIAKELIGFFRKEHARRRMNSNRRYWNWKKKSESCSLKMTTWLNGLKTPYF